MAKEGYFAATSFSTHRWQSSQTEQVGDTNRMRGGVPLLSLKRERSWLMPVSFLAPESGARVWQEIRLESSRARLIGKVRDLSRTQGSQCFLETQSVLVCLRPKDRGQTDDLSF